MATFNPISFAAIGSLPPATPVPRLEETQPLSRPEKTPKFRDLFDEPLPAAKVPMTVSVRRCYLCDLDLARVPAELVDRRSYEYASGPKRDGTARSYLISVCWRCRSLLAPQ